MADECVDELLILFVAKMEGDLILSRLVACHCLTTLGNMS